MIGKWYGMALLRISHTSCYLPALSASHNDHDIACRFFTSLKTHTSTSFVPWAWTQNWPKYKGSDGVTSSLPTYERTKKKRQEV